MPLASWPSNAPSPWDTPGSEEAGATARCNICRWTGAAFVGHLHSESALCPRCGSIARDRFLFHCFVKRTRPMLGARLLETSPRLGDDYRSAMASWFSYVCSDFDERAHRGVMRIDLQDIAFADASLDVVLTPHVLEHVPETDRALRELLRVLVPGGRVYLQVPLLQGRTAPPVEPEFHGDHTPVFWRFGFDLTERLRRHGFLTTLLGTDRFLEHVRSGADSWPEATSPEFDVRSMSRDAIAADLTSVAAEGAARQLGLLPAYMFFTWECVKPG